MDKLGVALQQEQALTARSNGLSSVPRYIHDLFSKIDRLEYKVDRLLEKLNEVPPKREQ